MITIIGAGLIGCYTAYLLAKEGYQVQVFEKNKRIAQDVRCTGLVTSEIKNLINLDSSLILNKVSKVKVNSKNNSVIFNFKNPEYVLDRKKLEVYLYRLAKNNRARFYFGHEFIGMKRNNPIIKADDEKKIFQTDILIGADGPTSKVSRVINRKPNKNKIGMQVRAKIKNNPDLYQTFLGPKYGHFAWIVPESEEISKIGMITSKNKKFQRFLKETNADPISHPSGIIPFYRNKKIKKGNIYLVGDAASQIKNTTGGGIIIAMKCASLLLKSIKENKSYPILFNIKIRKELISHDIIFRIMENMKDKDFDKLIELCLDKKVKNQVENADREHPLLMMIRIIIRKPSFLLFLPKLL